MNRFLQQGVLGASQAARSATIVGVDLARQLEQVALSAVTGVVVIGTGHLLGKSIYRGLGDAAATPDFKAARPMKAA